MLCPVLRPSKISKSWMLDVEVGMSGSLLGSLSWLYSTNSRGVSSAFVHGVSGGTLRHLEIAFLNNLIYFYQRDE